MMDLAMLMSLFGGGQQVAAPSIMGSSAGVGAMAPQAMNLGQKFAPGAESWLANPQNHGILASLAQFGGNLGGNPAVAQLGNGLATSSAFGQQQANQQKSFLDFLHQLHTLDQTGGAALPMAGGQPQPQATATAPNGTATAPAGGGSQLNFPIAPAR